MTESVNLTTVAPSFITDAAGGVWSLAVSVSSGAQVCYNGAIQSTTSNVAKLEYFNHTVYYQNSAGNWFVYKNGSWTASAAPGTNTESAQGTTVTTVGPAIYDSTLEAWTLVNSATSGMQIACNGVTDTVTGHVQLLLYWNHLVYQENTAGGWWSKSKSTDTWTSTTDPRVVATPTITGITLSNSSLAAGAASGTVVGSIAVTMTGGTWSGTLALSGTNASSFVIVGNNLVTNGVINAGTYSINIVATQAGAVGSPFTKSFSITATSSGTITPPPQAAAAGYHTLVFNDDFTSASTVTNNISLGVTPGINWYPGIGGQTSPTNYQVLTTTAASQINNGNSGGGSFASPKGGILAIYGINTMGYGANFQTTPQNNPNTTVGVFKHAYIEAYGQFNKDAVPSFGWIGWWSWSTRGSAANNIEVDFMEAGWYNTATNTGYAPSSGPAPWTVHDPGGGTNRGSGAMLRVPDSNWHAYGCLWKATSSTTGTLDFYCDNNHVGGPITTGAGMTVPDMEGIPGLWLTVGAGVGLSFYVDWVRVWQAP